MSGLKPPELVLSGNMRENFRLWRTRFNDYCIIKEYRDPSKTTDEEHYIQAKRPFEISSFRSALPNEVLKIVQYSVEPQLSIAEKTQPWIWMSKLSLHFEGEDTVMSDRYEFSEIKQLEGERVQAWETRVRQSAYSLEFDTMEDQFMRDRFVFGLLSSAMRGELLKLNHRNEDKSILTLATVVKHAKALEVASQANKLVEASNIQEQVSFVAQKKTSQCGYCGGPERHPRNKCPAARQGVFCRKCYGDNHFARVCRNAKDQYKKQFVMKKRVSPKEKKQETHAVETKQESDYLDEDVYYQYAMSLEIDHEISSLERIRKLFTDLSLSLHGDNFTKVPLQVDSAATCNTMPLDMFLKVGQMSDLKRSKATLVSYSGNTIKPVGQVYLMCETDNRFETIMFEVVQGQQSALLGLSDSLKLGLISFNEKKSYIAPHPYTHDSISNVSSQADGKPGSLSKEYILQAYKSSFEGRGHVGKPVSFSLDESVTPIHAPIHRIPVSKRDKVKHKLDEMVECGKLVKLEQPTSWCSNMTVVEKIKQDGSSKVRLCLDPSQTVNKAIQIPKHTIPIIQEMLPRLSGKTFKRFTIMDALDGFTQVALDEQSSLATTMQTPWGRYAWKVLPYGISSAPEEFQKRIQEVLEGLPGIANIADDMCIFGLGDTQEEADLDHDNNLLAFLERAKARGLKLNPSKIQFKLDAISFMGHKITQDGISVDDAKVKAITELPRPDNKKAVQRFLGMVNYLNSFCPSLSTVIHPLREIAKDGFTFNRSDVHEKAFTSAKTYGGNLLMR